MGEVASGLRAGREWPAAMAWAGSSGVELAGAKLLLRRSAGGVGVEGAALLVDEAEDRRDEDAHRQQERLDLEAIGQPRGEVLVSERKTEQPKDDHDRSLEARISHAAAAEDDKAEQPAADHPHAAAGPGEARFEAERPPK